MRNRRKYQPCHRKGARKIEGETAHIVLEFALTCSARFVPVQVDAWWQAGQVPIRLRSLCAALVRSAMTAHQRRGESDLVVHYLYQLLALDPAAPEWQRALQPADV